MTRYDSIIDLCLTAKVPVVTINRHELDHRASSVVSDDARGMQLAVDHLVPLGHQRIAHIKLKAATEMAAPFSGTSRDQPPLYYLLAFF